MRSDVGNMPPMPGVFLDYFAPIVRNGAGGHKLVMARWGMPPFEILKGKNRDLGVTKSATFSRHIFGHQRRFTASYG